MNSLLRQSLVSRARPHPGVAGALAGLLMLAALPQARAQTADFNSGTDAGWTHYTLLDYGAAKFTFPADDSGGKAYQIYAPPTGDDPWGMGNARAGSLRTDVVYSGRFSAGADLLAWNAVWRQETGLLFYMSDPGLGTTDGYAATYSSGYRNLYITLINDERDSGTVGELQGIVLDPTHGYRLQVSSHNGSTFLFQLFDKADLVNPWRSLICEDDNRTYAAGLCALFVWQREYPSADQGAEATFDNYGANVPASMPATVTDLSPQPGGQSLAVYPAVSVAILDRDTSVDPASIRLRIDGVAVPTADLTIEPLVRKGNNPGTKEFSGATVTYTIPTLFPWGSLHTNRVEFADSSGVWQTNAWVWSSAYPFLSASQSLPLGSLTVRGFDFRMAQSDNNCESLDNSLDRARGQLATPPQIPVDRSATGVVQVLGWDKTADPETGNNVPGLCAPSAHPTCSEYRNIAVECLAYLELTPGLHRFRVNTDDRAGVYSGLDAGDPSAQVWWESPGNTANATFDLVVEAAGLYPVRCLWEETGGGAQLYLLSVNPEDGAETPVNDPTNPAGGVKAWYPLVCRSAASAEGPFTVESAAANAVTRTDLVGQDCGPTVVGQKITGGTFTVPIAGATRFYAVEGPRAATITQFTKSPSSVSITYVVP